MATMAEIRDFLAQPKIAVVGVSRDDKKFGTRVYHELESKGYQLFPVNPAMDTFNGETCYPSLRALPEAIEAALVVVPPANCLQVVQDAHHAGIKRLWLQQGASSPEALAYCQENQLSAISEQCILMFAEPAGFAHRAHRWVQGLIKQLPVEA